MWYQDPWDALIERLLTVEYGNDIITHLSTPLLSQSAKSKIQRREKKLQHV
jgi:hypothetical protein